MDMPITIKDFSLRILFVFMFATVLDWVPNLNYCYAKYFLRIFGPEHFPSQMNVYVYSSGHVMKG